MTQNISFADDLADGRETPVNWDQLVQNIVDEYEKEMGIVHGVQKDAIQNGWDARTHPKGNGWSFEIQLYKEKNGFTYITLTDQGTHGLTGRVLTQSELEADLPPEERWGRFESLAFRKEEEGAIGARGQGKFVFVGASKEKVLYYDTLRKDKTYRLGARGVIGKTKSLIQHWDGEDGKHKLKERFPSLEPLNTVGTRIILLSPIEALIKSINDGTFNEMIGNTWWEIIAKYGVKIVVRSSSKEWEAVVPEHIKNMPDKDTKDTKVWLVENKDIDVPGEKCRVKRLHLVSNPNEDVPYEIRGVAIQRNGMKVCAVEPPRDLPKDMADGIYGYVEFDKELDGLMKVAESVTHYGFDWRRKGVAQVRRFIGDQITAFANVKLGYGQDPESRRKRFNSQAEKRALIAANRVAAVIGLDGVGFGTKKNPPPPPPPPPRLNTPRLEMSALELPGDDLRVEYGQDVGNIAATVYNESDENYRVQLKMWMFTIDGNVVYEFLPKIDFDLAKGNKKGPFGPFIINMNKNKFPVPGLYRIKARLVCLSSTSSEARKGDILDEVTKAFYLASDPPERIAGLFERIEGEDFSKSNPTLLGTHLPGERKGYIYKYNVKHPAFEAADDYPGASGEYLVRLLFQAIAEIDLQSDNPHLFEPEVLKSPSRVAEKMRILLGNWLHEYYQ